MNKRPSTTQLPAPCIVDRGIVANKQDMQKLLSGLNRVRYMHIQDGAVTSVGEGIVLDVFADDHQATLVANRTLYLNVCSFDYLEIGQTADLEPYFYLIQDRRQLQLYPLSNPLQEERSMELDEAALDAVFDRVLLRNFESVDDDEERFYL
jgi:hypothetical protein